ncbi:BadF/BadG/BcrA/BcrD ATPase family protein [Luteimicrobium xylanilyticum]|uniref:ATPase BadF/BadG/BcrA/BcrD type domain-containing protein n=1 Tax=Luteimicrobium xylanilyticum TaxID=1133546 RepID=A0A5P9QBE8_9MICO|nr:BadF/BadG/BcrA/BcrD ATPase family protein [Luteimicrobium xylanilyticum]QFU98773.1 hypothetical protein KDY119_02292 [Luteimicrobium xylanilyticum]
MGTMTADDVPRAHVPDPRGRVVVAVDGGGSKTDAVAVDLDGTVLGFGRGGASNAQTRGLATAVGVVDALVSRVRAEAALPVAAVGAYLAGLDLPQEITAFRAAVSDLAWAHDAPVHLDNDMFALLRTGTDAPDAVAVVCGTGINCVGVRADGRDARFPALGPISGDWGGGAGIAQEALWYAARAEDGRGRPTAFTTLIPRHFGESDLTAVVEGLHFGRIEHDDLTSLAPVVLAAAREGDPVARSIVDRLGDEIGLLARVALERLDLHDVPVPVVLGGGVLAAEDPGLLARVHDFLAPAFPRAALVPTRERPIVGAAVLTLADAGARPEAIARARAQVAAVADAVADAPVR